MDGVLRRVTNSQASQPRRKAFDQLICEGNSAPFLSLLGVSLASGSGIVTKEDEIESICFEIRQAISKTRLVSDDSVEEENDGYSWSLQDFDLGQPIVQERMTIFTSSHDLNPISNLNIFWLCPIAVGGLL